MPRRPRTVNANRVGPRRRSSRDTAAYPLGDRADGTVQERRRNVAAVRRATPQKPVSGRRSSGIGALPSLRWGFRGSCEKSRKLPLYKRFFVCRKVDKNRGRRLYTPSWARRRLVRWRVCEAPHCSHGDRIRPFRRGHVRVAASDVWGLTPPGHGGRSCKVPGCLTGESEERETWTAESLRTAFANGRASAFSVREAVMEETLAVDVLGQHYWISRSSRFAGNKSGTSSKRVICQNQSHPT
jgi:hypothetical protein